MGTIKPASHFNTAAASNSLINVFTHLYMGKIKPANTAAACNLLKPIFHYYTAAACTSLKLACCYWQSRCLHLAQTFFLLQHSSCLHFAQTCLPLLTEQLPALCSNLPSTANTSAACTLLKPASFICVYWVRWLTIALKLIDALYNEIIRCKICGWTPLSSS